MSKEPRRITREKRTVSAMVALYCRDHHGTGEGLCEECEALREYALCRLDKCPFGPRKTACATCPVHCYKPQMRTRVQEVMRYAGPRMLRRHPWLAIRHLLDGMRKSPRPKRADGGQQG